MASAKLIKDLPDHSKAPCALPDELFYYMARDIISKPSDIANLSRTCRRLSQLLEPLLYQADVWETRKAELESEVNVFRRARQYGSRYGGNYFDIRLGLQNCRVPVSHIPALHWAATQNDRSLGLAVARKSIKAALIHWPNYLHVPCGKTSNMTPLHLAAKNGLVEMVQELMDASAFVDARVRFNVNAHPGEFPLIQRTFAQRRFNVFGSFYLTINALCIAIMYGHIHIAEILAHHTQDLKETEGYLDIDPTPVLKLAAVHRMPSVVRILQDRGYQSRAGNWYFFGASALHYAAVADGNEETIQLLLDGGADINATNRMNRDAFELAVDQHDETGECVSNLLILANHLTLEERSRHFRKQFFIFLGNPGLLPVIKVLLGEDAVGFSPVDLVLLHEDVLTYLEGQVPGQASMGMSPETLDYLIHHPGLKFLEGEHSVEFWERKLEDMMNNPVFKLVPT
ncbi:ankyrin repeat-containing domain protein [Hypoxylon sp. FL0890]|nr:ankyrin repeat-containing domain protein [Hypoxylon sp. FL0890]